MDAAEFRKLKGLPPPGHDHHQNPHHRLPRAKPKCEPQAALGSEKKGYGGSDERTIVRLTSHRVRLLDSENHSGGCKHIIDCLRYQGYIIDDSPKHIRLETDQVQVSHYHEEYIEIIIIKP